MARTLIQVVTRVAQVLDKKHYFSGTTNSSGNAVGSVVCDALGRFNNNAIIGKHLYFTDQSPDPDSVIVTDFTSSTVKALIRPDLASAPNSEAFLVLPYRKEDIEEAIAQAIYTLHDTGDLTRQILMFGMVAGSPIYNAGFDYWTSSTTPDGWSKAGSATLAKEAAGANTFNSRQSLKISGAADYVRLDEPWKSWLEDFKGGTVRFYCPALTGTASNARIAVYDGTTIHYSGYHSGGGAREVLDTDAIEISATATDLEIRLYNDGTNAAYFGDCHIEGSQVGVREIPVPVDYASTYSVVEALESARPTNTTVGRIHHLGRGQTIYQQRVTRHTDHETTTRYGVMEFTGSSKPVNGRRLKVTASGQLSVPASDSGVIEITRHEELMVAYLSAALLLEEDAITRSAQIAADNRATAGELRGKVGQLAHGVGQRIAPVTMERSM